VFDVNIHLVIRSGCLITDVLTVNAPRSLRAVIVKWNPHILQTWLSVVNADLVGSIVQTKTRSITIEKTIKKSMS
jgi:hypothetical protein